MGYVNWQNCMERSAKGDIRDILSRISRKYMSDNPPETFTFRMHNQTSFSVTDDGRFDLNFLEKYPHAENGSYAYAYAKFYKHEEGNQKFFLSCYGPVRIFVNGKEVCRSAVSEEVNVKVRREVYLPFDKGENYPLGVTLYGLINTSRILGDELISDYVKKHIRICVELYKYSLWDKKKFGYPAINNQLVGMEMLDDCGSFGSAMLETFKDTNDTVKALAEKIADYISHGQERTPDGAFYRELKGHYMENTLWADDLYMSIPFLCRYYKLTGNLDFIKDAANQVLLFRNYLFMDDLKLMSHVYDFKYLTKTCIPWVRGNGWVHFSTAELLRAMPQSFELRDNILSFFNEICEGSLNCQRDDGMWSQVLSDRGSYAETSCTAMFIYSYCMGLLNGCFPEDKRDIYLRAVVKAWKSLCENMIDKYGNVFGVCRGSAYSFTADYYKYELTPRDNDTHGIGIVLLAGGMFEKILDIYKDV